MVAKCRLKAVLYPHSYKVSLVNSVSIDVKEEYESCPDFGDIILLKEGVTPEIDGFLLQDGYFISIL